MENYPTLTTEPGATELVADITAGKLSAIEAVEAAITRIEALDGPINAVVVRDFDRARQAARGADARLAKGERAPLLGVPMTVKESFDIAGLPTSWGVKSAANNIADEDALVVGRLKAAGAVILGKTNVPPMLTDWFAENPVYGRTSNPHDLERSPGGSSGGGAAAVASGMVACEFGSDIGASIRVPAHYCGVWGHKPTYGVIGSQGHSPPGIEEGASPALAVVGPLARSADDLELLFEVALDRPLPKNTKPLDCSRFLLIADHPSAGLDDALRRQIENVVGLLEDAGAEVARESDLLPGLENQHRDYMRMLNIALSGGAPRADGSETTVRTWFELCDAQFRNQQRWRALFEEFDYVLAPPSSTAAFLHDTAPMKDRTTIINGQQYPFGQQLAWAGLATFPGLPSTVLPIGEAEGLPVGLQVIAERYNDHDTIDAARQIAKLLVD